MYIRRVLSVALAAVSSLAYCKLVPKPYVSFDKEGLSKHCDNIGQGFGAKRGLPRFRISPNKTGLPKHCDNIGQGFGAKRGLPRFRVSPNKTGLPKRNDIDQNFGAEEERHIRGTDYIPKLLHAFNVFWFGPATHYVDKKIRAGKVELLKKVGVKLSIDKNGIFDFSFGDGEKKICLYLSLCSLDGNLAIASSSDSDCHDACMEGGFIDIDRKIFAKFVRYACEFALEKGYKPLEAGVGDKLVSKVIGALTYLRFGFKIGEKIKIWRYFPKSNQQLNNFKFNEVHFLDQCFNVKTSKTNKN